MTQEIEIIAKETLGEQQVFDLKVNNYDGGMKLFIVKLE